MAETFGRYELVERIGQGGMAEVFRARYSPLPGFSKTLVVKRILPHLCANDYFVQMFKDEAKITGQLAHANIVQVFDFGEFDRLYFLAMEYVRGVDLRELLTRTLAEGKKMNVGLAAYITCEMARALAYAHSAHDQDGTFLGIIHRDLNPPNVLLSTHGDVKISDFGISKNALQVALTQVGQFKGKLRYAAPETLRHEPTDHRSDLWALGCCLYEMLSGEHPFKLHRDDSDQEKVRRIVREKLRPISQIRDDVPAPLERALDLLMMKDPDARASSGSEIVEMLSAVVPPNARARLAENVCRWFAPRRVSEPTPTSPATRDDFSAVSQTVEAFVPESERSTADAMDRERVQQLTADVTAVSEVADDFFQSDIPTADVVAVTNVEIELSESRPNRASGPSSPRIALDPPVEPDPAWVDAITNSERQNVDETFIKPSILDERSDDFDIDFNGTQTDDADAHLPAEKKESRRRRSGVPWHWRRRAYAAALFTSLWFVPIGPVMEFAAPTLEKMESRAAPLRNRSKELASYALGAMQHEPAVEVAPDADLAPLATSTGTLGLRTVPKSQVFVDGRALAGVSWTHRLRLPEGKRQIRLVSATEGLECQIEVDVAAEKRVIRTVDLRACKL